MLTLAALSLVSFLGVEDEATQLYRCSNPAFSVTRMESPVTDHQNLLLKGTLATPQQGYSYGFQFVGINGNQANAVIAAGQHLSTQGTYGRGLPSVGQMAVEQAFDVPQQISYLNISVSGLSQQPFGFFCDLANPTPIVKPELPQNDRFKPN